MSDFAIFERTLAERAMGEAWGAVVMTGGDVVFEAYGDGGSDASKWEVGSIRKSVCSTLLGVAIEEGRLSLDTPVVDVWPEIVELGAKKDRGILVRHLATNTSGWMLDHGPGGAWVYNNAACTAGNCVVGRVFSQVDDRIAPLVKERIADVIGAEWDCYHYEEPFAAGSHGTPGPKLAIDSTLRDLSRFGQLWLEGGNWNGDQLVLASYVKEATTNQVADLDAHYGYWWFTNDDRVTIPPAPEDAFFHIGHGREKRRTLFICVPSLATVVAIGTHLDAFDISDHEAALPVVEALFSTFRS